jgi:hypothetical protein
MDRQRRACGSRPQVVLTFDSAALLDHFQVEAFVSPINSGNARRKSARRGRVIHAFRMLRGYAKAGARGGRVALQLNSSSDVRFRPGRLISLMSLACSCPGLPSSHSGFGSDHAVCSLSIDRLLPLACQGAMSTERSPMGASS